MLTVSEIKRGSREVVFVGDTRDSLQTLFDNVAIAYGYGYNSLFVAWDNSYHDANYDICAQKRTTGRIVNNPFGWIAKTVGKNMAIQKSLKTRAYALYEENRSV